MPSSPAVTGRTPIRDALVHAAMISAQDLVLKISVPYRLKDRVPIKIDSKKHQARITHQLGQLRDDPAQVKQIQKSMRDQ